MLNQCNFIGRLGRKPEQKLTSSNAEMSKFSVAVDKFGKDEKGNKLTTWVNIVAFGKTAEFANKYLDKGSLVFVSGELDISAYEKDGVKTFYTSINARQINILESGNAERRPGNPKHNSKETPEMNDDELPF